MPQMLLLALATCLVASSAAAQARNPTVTNRALRVFASAPTASHGAAGAVAVAVPAAPSLPDLDKLKMTALSLPNSGVKGVSSNFRLSASRPVADGDRGTLWVQQATTQPEFGRDGSILFDDLGNRPPGMVRLRLRLTEVGRPHLVDCTTVNKPGIDWEMTVGAETERFSAGAAPFTTRHLTVIVVPSAAGSYEVVVAPRLAGPPSGYLFTTLGYCEVTLLK
jgi:hypothetical protein